MSNFTSWTRDNLEKFAQEAAEENRQLRLQIHDLLRAYRAEVVRNAANEPVRKIRGKWLERMEK